jgi:error-prone DNA polymerase
MSVTYDRRRALWTAGAAARTRPGDLIGMTTAIDAPALPGMSAVELATAGLWATGIISGTQPIEFLRVHLDKLGATPTARLLGWRTGRECSSVAPRPRWQRNRAR